MIQENFEKRSCMGVLPLALLALVKEHFLEFSFLISFLLLVPPVGAATLKVMTQNQYLGADLAPILAASDANEFNAAVARASAC
jgi:hypothetical protein